MEAISLDQAQIWLHQQQPLYLAFVLAALYIISWLAASAFQFAVRWTKVGLGTRHIPVAPGGNWLLGHVFPLATNCAWEQMHEWVRNSPPLVRFRILHRTGIVVGDALAIKRIFQVRRITGLKLETLAHSFSFNNPPPTACWFE
jgi:hypothetical protein